MAVAGVLVEPAVRCGAALRQPEGQSDAPLSAQLKQNNDSRVLPPYVDDYREP